MKANVVNLGSDQLLDLQEDIGVLLHFALREVDVLDVCIDGGLAHFIRQDLRELNQSE